MEAAPEVAGDTEARGEEVVDAAADAADEADSAPRPLTLRQRPRPPRRPTRPSTPPAASDDEAQATTAEAPDEAEVRPGGL